MMNRDLFLAILSMDAYNRGYNAGINGLGETGMIGNAVISAATAEQKEGWEAAGFYAIAYNWNGKTIISYRGTNFPNSFSPGDLASFLSQDFLGGWSIFTGLGTDSHATFAREFFNSVTGQDFPLTENGITVGIGNLTLTGHSLGGGLAGYIGARSYADAVNDNFSREVAA